LVELVLVTEADAAAADEVIRTFRVFGTGG
jgi:hypothetical protein